MSVRRYRRWFPLTADEKALVRRLAAQAELVPLEPTRPDVIDVGCSSDDLDGWYNRLSTSGIDVARRVVYAILARRSRELSLDPSPYLG